MKIIRNSNFSINKKMFYWNAAMLPHLHIIHDCFGTTMENLSSCNRDCEASNS